MDGPAGQPVRHLSESGDSVKRILSIVVLALVVAILAPAAPAQAVNSWANVYDADQTSSKSGKSTFTFPFRAQCPDSFHVSVAFIKWGYSSPAGPTVRITSLKLRLKPHHKMRVTIDGRNRWYPKGEYTTRSYAISTDQDFPLLHWDGSDAVGVDLGVDLNTSTYYAPGNYSVAGACKAPTHLAGLRKLF